MDQSKALHQLMDAVDLLSMIEDMTSPQNLQQISASSISGLRISLRNARNAVLASHDALAKDLVTRSSTNYSVSKSSTNTKPSEAFGAAMTEKKNLRSSLDQFVE